MRYLIGALLIYVLVNTIVMHRFDQPRMLILLVDAILLPPLIVAGVILRRNRRDLEGPPPHCQECEYSIFGIDGGRCPECGFQNPLGDIVESSFDADSESDSKR
jgi:hypothetical protein